VGEAYIVEANLILHFHILVEGGAWKRTSSRDSGMSWLWRFRDAFESSGRVARRRMRALRSAAGR